MQFTDEHYDKAVKYILEHTSHRPKKAIILGSGLGEYAENLKDADIINYEDIPNFPRSTVEGHKGRFVINDDIICMQGRVHYYEGYSMEEVTFPTRVLSLLGVRTLIVTNAAGGINKNFDIGDLMLITDHINFMGMNPLRGANKDRFGVRFPDMSEAYSLRLRETAAKKARELGIVLREGVYIAMSGPSYETPAEIRMAGIMGADAVGMSTVPEVIVAKHCGMEVLGITCVSNLAAGISEKPLSMEDVLEASIMVKDKFLRLIDGILEEL
ncbi:MAG: purine-nucleoside phosphorylase [Lachnospiraceae bacterium]|jgi:purine-nucleoside phosphorylase